MRTIGRHHLARRLLHLLAPAALLAGPLATLGAAPAMAVGPAIDLRDATVVEGNAQSTANVTITLSAPSSQPVDVFVGLDTANSSATQNSDFLANSQTLRFDPGITARTFGVIVVGDTLNENDERVRVVASVQGGDADAGFLTIRDDDRPTVVKPGIPSARVTEGDPGRNPVLVFTVRLDRAPAQRATLVYSARNTFGGANPATPGVDFIATSGVLTFEPGQTSKTIAIQTISDNLNEPDERVIVNLSTPINLQFPGTVSGMPGLILHGDIGDDD